MTDTAEVRAIDAVVSGRVHGVGFRYSTQRFATDLGLSGWVRNLPDGTVGVQAQGDPSSVESLCVFLRKGPPAARVTSLDILEVSPEEAVTGFSVRY